MMQIQSVVPKKCKMQQVFYSKNYILAPLPIQDSFDMEDPCFTKKYNWRDTWKSLDSNFYSLYGHQQLIVFLVVTKNHVSPGISPGLFLFGARKEGTY
jgi:hypothetical protein